MRQRAFALVFATALLALGALASTAAASVRVYVSPTTGKPTTKFVVRFRAPSATGVAVHRHYELYASGARGTRCTSSVSMAIGATNTGSHVRLTLKPKGRGGTWCAGKFHGRIVEYTSIICRPLSSNIVCVNLVIAPQTIGRFSFSVSKASGSGTGTGTGTQSGPTFAGLQTATECIMIRPIITRARYINLSWNAATDPVTPSSQIVYDIYYSGTAGAENFSSPNWTTAPGATSDTVELTNDGPAYFVVRARDTAGHEDHNTVERSPVNTCTNG